jgi:hypothetical protein
LDAACWALDLAAPRSVEAFAAGNTNDEIAPHGILHSCVRNRSGGCPPGVKTYSFVGEYLLTIEAKGEYRVSVVRNHRLLRN